LATLAADQFARPVDEEQPVIVVLVIHREQTMRGRRRAVRQRIELHAIVMHARLQGLVCRRVAGVEAGTPAIPPARRPDRPNANSATAR
jgi:hypothetical protein